MFCLSELVSIIKKYVSAQFTDRTIMNAVIFFGIITDTVRRWNGIPCILGGDWNATICSDEVTVNPDVMFMRSIPSRFRSERIAELCEDLDLSDPFRTLHPEDKEFTYYPSGTQRKNRSRIDFFLISSCLYRTVESCTIAQSFCRKNFDHKPIFLNLKKSREKEEHAFMHPLRITPLRLM
jgi:exonuclease III